MTKKRLKKTPRQILTVIVAVLGVLLVSVDDFSLGALPLILALGAVEVGGLTILEKF